MAFTDKEITLIRTTWTPVRSAPSNWPKLFLILFDEEPAAQKLFKSFADLPKDELGANKRFKAHVAHFVSLLSGFVDFLDDPETMTEMVQNMAIRHYKRKVTLHMFEKCGIAMMKWLKEIVGESIDEEAVEVWTKLYNEIFSIIKDQYLELDNSSS